MIGALSVLLKANEDAGTIRVGLDPDDILLILGFLWRIDPKTDWASRAARPRSVERPGRDRTWLEQELRP